MYELILPDGSRKNAEEGSSFLSFIEKEIGEGLARNAVAVDLDGVLLDVAALVKSGHLRVITLKDPEGLEILRHSTSHIMADAVTQLFPGTKVTIGPAVENGFYYDFDSDHRFTSEDLEIIEDRMREIIKQKLPFIHETIPAEQAILRFKALSEIYKVEIIKDLGVENVKLYSHGTFTDLCRGPHLPNTGYVKAFKLLSVAGAYWRGDEKNKMLQRIYGTAFSSKEDLKEHINFLEEARERDHRKIGKELGLFEMAEEVGPGLALWTPKGGKIRTVIENFWRKEHYKNGYDLVYTPHIGRGFLWETSGHLDFYKEGMYSPMDIDGEDYYVKPMNCPFHIMLYKGKKWSYRDFPFRWAELGTVYRYEKSGTLNGLKRVRGFTQDDAHLFCRIDQLEDEIKKVLDFSIHILSSFDFSKFKVFLSTRPEKFVGEVETWNKAEKALESVLKESGLDFEINAGDGAFYGPKIDINVTDSIGRNWQLSTIQVDFQLPERFDLTYVGSDGNEHRPIMLHRALLGSLERFFGVLIEHYKGSFPLWLAPVQVAVLPVSEKHIEIADRFEELFRRNNIRVEVDKRNEKIGYKIREWSMLKVPYTIVVGDKEAEMDEITVRTRGGEQSVMNLEGFLQKVNMDNKGGIYF